MAQEGVGVYQDQEGGKCREPVVGCVLCAHCIPMSCSDRYCEDTACVLPSCDTEL